MIGLPVGRCPGAPTGPDGGPDGGLEGAVPAGAPATGPVEDTISPVPSRAGTVAAGTPPADGGPDPPHASSVQTASIHANNIHGDSSHTSGIRTPARPTAAALAEAAQGRGEFTPLPAGQTTAVRVEDLNAYVVGAGIEMLGDPGKQDVGITPRHDRVDKPV